MNERLTIGQLAKLTGVPPKTIRYYEEVGILPPPERPKPTKCMISPGRRLAAETTRNNLAIKLSKTLAY